jgi:DNA-binding IclR family transcriptional regulator
VFCAHLAPEKLQTMWANQSGGTSDIVAPSERKAFDATLAAIRDRGIERGIDAPSPGISSLAAPVLDADGQLCLALTVIGPSGTIDVNWDGPIARALRQAAREIGADIAAD